ncbi:hypothetical protein BaRGS_00030235 [Batillaria attramentaria]|uniref:Uncharacterized protein n=1 Tax=Batillaria attramentaria TaxID=370345 RepID=A0ABD0JTP2_9CAEN
MKTGHDSVWLDFPNTVLVCRTQAGSHRCLTASPSLSYPILLHSSDRTGCGLWPIVPAGKPAIHSHGMATASLTDFTLIYISCCSLTDPASPAVALYVSLWSDTGLCWLVEHGHTLVFVRSTALDCGD